MKLFVGLALVVITVANAHAAISTTIPMSAPSESSASNSLDSECPKIVCAAIMNWDECAMLLPERCRPKKKDYGAWGEHILLSDTTSNESGGSVNEQSSSSACPDICPDIYSPVCGSDGVKYSNPCEMKTAACRNPGLNIVESGDDACVSSKAKDE